LNNGDMAEDFELSLGEARRLVVQCQFLAGPLPGEAIEDRAAVGWTSTGWTNGRNVERMLDILWKLGIVTVAGRDGPRRLWEQAEAQTAVRVVRDACAVGGAADREGGAAG
jgi:hypothetical protein